MNGGDADKEGPLGGEHTKACYTDELICGYIVDEDNIASDSDAIASDSNAEHTHTQECYALDCPYENGEHKVNGVPAKTIAAWTFIDDDNYLTEGVLALPGVNAGRQANFDTVVSMLPTQIRAEVEGETDSIPVDITGWSCQEFAKGPDGNWPLTGEYTFTAKLQEGYVCEPLPTVKVLVGGAEFYGNLISGDGYTFNKDNGELTITNNNGTVNWENGQISREDVKTLILDNGVTAIAQAAFSECVNLGGTLSIPANMTSIGTNAFASTKITSLDLSNASNLETIDAGAFTYIATLSTVKIPRSVKIIGQGAFQKTALTSVDLSEAENLTYIGVFAFEETEISSITIPSSVTTVDNFAFFSCSKLTSVTFTRQSAPTLGTDVFDGTSQNLVIHVPDDAIGYDGANWPTDKVVKGPALPLTALTISHAALTPGFSMGQQNYTATVPTTVTSVTVTPFSEGMITVNGKSVASGNSSDPIDLEIGKENKIEIVVKTSETLNRTYTVTVTWEGAPSTLTLAAAPGSSLTYPGSVTLTAALSVASGENAGKTIQFTGSGTFTATTNGSGVATCSFTNLTPGTYNFVASFAGDKDNQPAMDELEVTVDPRDISNVMVNVTGSRVYTGSQLRPVFGVNDGNIAITDDDYMVSYGANVDAGADVGSITLTGQNNYTGTKTVVFDIEKRSLAGAAITLGSTSYTYNGSEIKPAVAGVVVDGVTVPASAFDVGYTNNTEIGTATVTITARADSSFTGSASTTFEITRFRSSDSDSSDDGSYTNPDILRGSWVQTEAGVWMFRQTGGSYAMNRWGMVDGLWYFFDAEGKMLSGWQFLGGQWYYLCTKEDLAVKAGMKEGAMASGWHFDPLYQKWFYLDTNGAMITGWREIDGKWHYFNPASDGTRGTMVTDSVIDGRYIDKNGVWNGEA